MQVFGNYFVTFMKIYNMIRGDISQEAVNFSYYIWVEKVHCKQIWGKI